MVIDKIKKINHTNEEIAKNEQASEMLVGKWIKCDNCKEILYKEDVHANLSVCPNCGKHFRISSRRRIAQLVDEGTFEEINENIGLRDPLQFEGYQKKLEMLVERTQIKEAVQTGIGRINGQKAMLAVMDGNFMMGSMGSVVGEKITSCIEEAIKQKLPVILICVSGGARMQEGIISLMQMAKTARSAKEIKRSRSTFYLCINRPNNRWSYSKLCKFRRYYHSRAKSINWICRTKSHRTNSKTKIARRFSTCRIFIRTWFY